MKFLILVIISSSFLSKESTASGNDTTHVKFYFDPSLNIRKFQITINDGIHEYNIKPQTSSDWNGLLFSPFGHISIIYDNSDTTSISKYTFFKSGNTRVDIIPSPTDSDYFSIDTIKSSNTITYDRLGGAALDSFIKKQTEDFRKFIFENRRKIGQDYDITQRAVRLNDSIVNRKILFIRRFPGLYISFWTFQHDVVNLSISPDSLLAFYNSVLSDAYKGSKAEEYIVTLIQNKITFTSKGDFPHFSATDIENKKIESSKLRGKYILVQFWASWCTPCIHEMPDLKSINDKYGGPDFKLISYSIDRDSTAFRKAIDKYSMNWSQIFGNLELYKAIGYTSIPQLYLIDRSGRTIYNDVLVSDPNLTRLKKLLSEQLGK